MGQALTTKIKVKDGDGRIVDEKEVALYAGLLARAHDDGLKSVITELLQIPTKDNHMVAIAKAQVTTSKGSFNGIGDACPENVNRKIVPHLIRMAETRAKARAMRDAVNIGMVCLEELGGDEGDSSMALDERGSDRRSDNVRDFRNDREERGRGQNEHHSRDHNDRGDRSGRREERGGGQAARRPDRDELMSDAQRRLIYRMLADDGFEGDQATEELLRRAEVPNLTNISKKYASRLIDEWKRAGRAA